MKLWTLRYQLVVGILFAGLIAHGEEAPKRVVQNRARAPAQVASVAIVSQPALDVRIVAVPPANAPSEAQKLEVTVEQPETLLKVVSDVGLLLATVALAYFTWRLKGATDRLAEGAESASRAQARAYVDLSPGQLNVPIDPKWVSDPAAMLGSIQLLFDLTNRGATPALVLKMWVLSLSVPAGAVPPEERLQVDTDKVKPHAELAILNPGASVRNTVILTLEPLTQVLAAATEQSDAVIYGLVQYTDAFGDTHDMPYCRLLNPKASRNLQGLTVANFIPRVLKHVSAKK